jgi:FMN phosphatase YigB (HAD superfamily)
MKTLIVDIDGTLIEQHENYIEKIAAKEPFKALPGTLEKLREWERKDYRLILITGRKEGSRRVTEKMLDELGIFYDQLIMGVGIGPRILINDLKPGRDTEMAVGINLKRNHGIGDIDI